MQRVLRRSSIEEEIRQLENKKSGLSRSRKSRSARTGQTGSASAWGFWEQTITTEHSRRILDGLTAQNAATAPT